MNDSTFHQWQAAQLQELLDLSAEDPLLARQLKQRAEAASQQLRSPRLPFDEEPLPRVAVFLSGGGVEGSSGIRPSLAGEALIQYERMFTEQALHDERQAARQAGRQRRQRGSASPGLIFTGTPRGSFGLEFSPQPTADQALIEIHGRSLHHVADAIEQITSDRPLEESLERIPAGVMQPLRQWLAVLAHHGAEVRLAFGDGQSTRIDGHRIVQAVERLNRELQVHQVQYQGIFRGLTMESLQFDLLVDNETRVSGSVAEGLDEEDLARIHQLTNRPCRALVEVSSMSTVGKGTSHSYLLLDAFPLDQPGSIQSDVTEPLTKPEPGAEV